MKEILLMTYTEKSHKNSLFIIESMTSLEKYSQHNSAVKVLTVSVIVTFDNYLIEYLCIFMFTIGYLSAESIEIRNKTKHKLFLMDLKLKEIQHGSTELLYL